MNGMNLPLVFITQMKIDEKLRAIYHEMLGEIAELIFADKIDQTSRKTTIDQARVLIASNIRTDLLDDERSALANVGFIQALTAGVDHIPFSTLPDGVPVAYNPGIYAAPMAEHILAMAFAAGKRLRQEHAELRDGNFNQFIPNRQMAGSNCAILGFGGVGQATARMFRPLGISIHAINRSGETDEEVASISTVDNLKQVLKDANIVVVGLSLTRKTMGLIGARELNWMKPDAILINVSRGEIIDQTSLYEHLVANQNFTACIDAWWIEPIRHGDFSIKHPFLDLPNVIASPHNSAQIPGIQALPARAAARNVQRFLLGEMPHYLVGDDERLR